MTERPLCRRDNAVGLGRQHGLELYLVHHECLDELRLGQRGLDLQNRLVGEYRGALADGVNVAGEAEVGKP